MAPDSPAPDPAAPADSPVEAVSALADGLRRRLYGFIRAARRPVTREEAAAEAGISARLAAFHLDKLQAAGLLRARYGSPGTAPKVGRKPKVYEPSDAVFRVSIPERRPDLLAEILLDAVLAEEPGEDARATAVRTARARGTETGAAERARTRPGPLDATRSLTLAEGILRRYGFEPGRPSPASLQLLNCPFHPLAARSPELVCGINHAFVTGVLEGLEACGVRAALVPREGQCCVELCVRYADTGPGAAAGI